MSVLELHEVRKSYRDPAGNDLPVLDVTTLRVEPGQQVALYGPSGSGKTTLLHVIAGILVPDAGRVLVDGVDLTTLSESERDRLRAERIGYVFQSFHLLPGYTALENVLLGMAFGVGVDRTHAEALLRELGLGDRLDHRPGELSIGQQQRVALARALAGRPKLVLADEPTGNLDPSSARVALESIRRCCADVGAALLLVSHDQPILDAFDDRLSLVELNRAVGVPAERAEGGEA